MPTYRIEVTKRAQKELDALDSTKQKRVLAAIAKLQEDPRPPGCKKLAGEQATYRIRIGDYRALYAIEDATLVLLVLRVGHRREIYRR